MWSLIKPGSAFPQLSVLEAFSIGNPRVDESASADSSEKPGSRGAWLSMLSDN